MNPRVKHWLIFGIFAAVIIACVVVTSIFGDITLPNDMKIIYNKDFVLTSYSVKENLDAFNATPVDVGDSNMSELHFLKSLEAEAAATTIKFNKQENKCIIHYFNKSQSVDFSKKGPYITISTQNMPGVISQTNRFRIYQDTMTNTYDAGRYTVTQKYAARELNMALAEKRFKFESYTVEADETAEKKLSSFELYAINKQMTVNLQRSWLFFEKIRQSNAYVKFVNAFEATSVEWQYLTMGVGTCLYPTSAAESPFLSQNLMCEVQTDAVAGERIVINSYGENYKETITYTRDNYNKPENSFMAGYSSPSGKKLRMGNIQVTNNPIYSEAELSARIEQYIAAGLYTPPAGLLTSREKVEAFKNFMKVNNVSLGFVPKLVSFSNNALCNFSVDETLTNNTVLQSNTNVPYLDANDVSGKRHIQLVLPGLPGIKYADGTDVSYAHAYTLDFEEKIKGSLTFDLVLNTPFSEIFTFTVSYSLSN